MPADRGKRPYEWDSIPGPGAYPITDDRKGSGLMGDDGPRFSMVGRKAWPGAATSPGPIYSPRATGLMGDGSQYTFGSCPIGHPARPGCPTRTPGPGDYETRTTAKGASSLGDQPKYGFGSAVQREVHSARNNRFISHQHAQTTNFGASSPGPMQYQMQDGFNTQMVESPQKNSPRCACRTQLPDHTPCTRTRHAHAIRPQCPRHAHPVHNAHARYTFRAKLPGYQTAAASPATSARSPGPGRCSCHMAALRGRRTDPDVCVLRAARSYNTGGAFGPQLSSGVASAGSYSFGSSERQSAELNYKKVTYMGKDFHHANLCEPSTTP